VACALYGRATSVFPRARRQVKRKNFLTRPGGHEFPQRPAEVDDRANSRGAIGKADLHRGASRVQAIGTLVERTIPDSPWRGLAHCPECRAMENSTEIKQRAPHLTGQWCRRRFAMAIAANIDTARGVRSAAADP